MYHAFGEEIFVFSLLGFWCDMHIVGLEFHSHIGQGQFSWVNSIVIRISQVYGNMCAKAKTRPRATSSVQVATGYRNIVPPILNQLCVIVFPPYSSPRRWMIMLDASWSSTTLWPRRCPSHASPWQPESSKTYSYKSQRCKTHLLMILKLMNKYSWTVPLPEWGRCYSNGLEPDRWKSLD